VCTVSFVRWKQVYVNPSADYVAQCTVMVILEVQNISNEGGSIAHAVRCSLLTAKAQVQSRVTSCGIYGA
jgi:hypothetical protein